MSLEWGRWIETAVSFIDDDHKLIFEINNKLIEEINAGADINIIRSILSAFCYIYSRHIQSEERVMIETSYSHYRPHKLHHDIFKHLLKLLECETNEISKTNDSISFIMIEFISTHLDCYDKPFARFLKDNELSNIIAKFDDDSEIKQAIKFICKSLSLTMSERS